MPVAVASRNDLADPFAEFMTPPEGESPSEKSARLRREAEQLKVSKAIDEEIDQARVAMKKEKESVVKVLLLGQSESGKSTTLKNFRIAYDQENWLRERASWRAVVQLNLIRSIGIILDALQAEAEGEPMQLPSPFPTSNDDDDDDTVPKRNRASTTASEFVVRKSTQPQLDSDGLIPLSEIHANLRRKLAPLTQVEVDLRRVLGVGTEEVRSMDQEGGDERDNVALPSISRSPSPPRRAGKEVFVRPWSWKEALQTNLHGSVGPQYGEQLAGLNADSRYEESGLRQAASIIANSKDDMKTLWMDDTTRRVLRKRNIRIEESAGFFLEDLDRIATQEYQPSDDDIVRCRLRTVGVQEYRISFDAGKLSKKKLDWILYDVGGSRTVRRAWIPYFENVNAIIFRERFQSLLSLYLVNETHPVAPISAFDEGLLEDPSVNRLQDTVSIWKAICTSPLLTQTTLVCFMNKCDLLRAKLKAGVRFNDYVVTFGEDTPNDTASVVRYLKNRFKETVIKASEDTSRMVYLYPTSCTDTRATAETLRSVRDSILRTHLKDAGLF